MNIAGVSWFIRAHGLWFLLVPVAWCLTAILRGNASGEEASISRPQFVAGIVITVTVMVVFTLCAGYAIHSTLDPGIQRM
jgi:hypothetical protein